MVGLALLAPGAASAGPLQWSAPEHRFFGACYTSNLEAMPLLFPVVDVVAIGRFSGHGQEPLADDIRLLP